MGTITGQSLADNAAGLIHDTNRIRWSDADWLTWLNDGQRDAVIVKPDVYVLNSAVALTASSTKQDLPASGLQLFDVTRNMGANGSTPGKTIRVVAGDIMDSTSPNWHTDAATGEITNYIYDPRDPKHFYVYPKAPATTWYIEIAYSAVPTALSALTETITLDDIYANALLNYMLYRAHSRDEVYGETNRASDQHYQLYLTALGAKLSAQAVHNPNLTTSEHITEVPAAAAKPS